MVVMVGGKVVPNGSNYSTIITTTGGPAYMSEEKEEVDSVADVEAQVVGVGEDEGKEFSTYIENLPMEIAVEEGGSPLKADPPGKEDPPESPAVTIAKAAVAAAVATLGGEDDGGGKPAAAPTPVAKVIAGTGSDDGDSVKIVAAGSVKPRPFKPRTTLNADKDARWMASVDLLREFKRINGHCNVPYHRPPHLTHIMSWCHSQRRLYKTGRMHPARIETLEAVGFLWNAPKGRGNTKGNLTWEQRFTQLQDYKMKHGTLVVDPETLDANLMALNQWTVTQKANYHLAKLAATRIHQLDSIGFDWGPPIPVKVKKEPGATATKKRPAASAGATITINSPAAKRTKLSTSPIVAKAPPRPASPPPADETEWVEMFEKLQKVKRKNKVLPTSFPNDKALDRWVRHQKQLLRKEDLHRSRMQRLHRLGFELPPGVTFTTYQIKKKLAKAAAANKKALVVSKVNPPQKLPTQPLQNPIAKKAATKSNLPKMIMPGGPIPPGAAFPGGGPVPPPGAFPQGMPWNPFMPPFPYGPPPPMGMPYGMPPPQPGPGAKNSPTGKSPAKNQQLPTQNAALQSQNDALQAMQVENANLRAENEQLQVMHRSMMTSMEEEKMLRRQGNQELRAKIEKQEQTITIQGSTMKKQGQQIKLLVDQMKDVVTRQKELQSVQDEQTRKQQEVQRLEDIRLAEAQRQRDMQELQRQQEEQERQDQSRRQQEQQRQNELYLLRQHGLF